MREFKVGDKVRWYEISGQPLWDFGETRMLPGPGKWVEGVVTLVTDAVFDVPSHSGIWRWPQPDHCRALYGEPGYLELVDAVKEPRFAVIDEGDAGLYIDDSQVADEVCRFPESCLQELELICAKLNEENQP
jgi:hypothetical protein